MKQILVSILLLSSILSFAQEGARIQVHVKGLEADKAYLAFYFGGKTLMMDSAEVVNSTATFEADTLMPEGMYLVALPPDMAYFDLFLDGDQQFSLQTDLEDLVGLMEVEGSQVNSIFYNDIRFLTEQQEAMTAVQAQLDTASSEEVRAGLQDRLNTLTNAVADNRLRIIDQHPDLLYARFLLAVKGPEIPAAPEGADEYWEYYWYRQHYFDYLDLSDPAMLRTPIAERKVMSYLDMVMQDPDTLIEAVDRIISLSSGNTETFQHYLSTLFNHFVESKRLTSESVMMHIAEKYYLTGKAPWVDPDYLEELRNYVRKHSGTLVGDKGQDFEILNLEDQPVRLYDTEADWIVLYFWSYDCGTCKKVTPELVEMIPDYLGEGVQLVTVCTNGDREIWKEKVAEYGIPGIALADPGRTSGFDREYNVESTPMIYVLDRDFVIRYKQISIEDLGAVLDYELKNGE